MLIVLFLPQVDKQRNGVVIRSTQGSPAEGKMTLKVVKAFVK